MIPKLSSLLGCLSEIEESQQAKNPDFSVIAFLELHTDGSGCIKIDFGKIGTADQVFCRINTSAGWELLFEAYPTTKTLEKDLYFFEVVKHLKMKYTVQNDFRFFFMRIYRDGSGEVCGQTSLSQEVYKLHQFFDANEFIQYLTEGEF